MRQVSYELSDSKFSFSLLSLLVLSHSSLGRCFGGGGGEEEKEESNESVVRRLLTVEQWRALKHRTEHRERQFEKNRGKDETNKKTENSSIIIRRV